MKHWTLWLVTGVLSLLGGLFALANPLAASLTAEQVAAWMFMIIGILTIISGFRDQGWGARILAIIMGGIIFLVGINLLQQPLKGLLALTYVVAILLIAAGVFKILMGIRTKISNLRWAMILSGALSLILGAMILANFPQSAATVLGVYLAIELISSGISLITLAFARKSLGAQPEPAV